MPPSFPPFPQRLGCPSVLAMATRSDTQTFAPLRKRRSEHPTPLCSHRNPVISELLFYPFPKEISDGHPGVVVGIVRSLPGKRVAPLLGAVPCATHTGSGGSRRVPCRFLQRPLIRPWAQDTGESGWSLQKPGRPSGDPLSICFFLAFPGSLVGLGGGGGGHRGAPNALTTG